MSEDISKEDISENEVKKNHSWRDWHEREMPIKVEGKIIQNGIHLDINSKPLSKSLELIYPQNIWDNFAEENQTKFLDNVNYIFTCHLPFLLKGTIRLEYNTGYPQVVSWANQCFMRYLSAYWYVYRGQRGTRIFPLLKTLLNSRAVFSQSDDIPPDFPVTSDKNVIIPFTFGKDSFLTYCLCKEMGLKTTLVYFNEPTEQFSAHHKLDLIKKFNEEIGEEVFYLENAFGKLREYGDGWFGWELALTSWALLCLPFAHYNKAGYIIFANEISCNDFFYDEDNFKVIPDYEQSAQATEEISLLTQALSEGEVYTTTFLQGIFEIAVVAILKDRYRHVFKYLMSCWAETALAQDRRWCCGCTKCARIYLFLVACGVDPAEAGFEESMFTKDKINLYNIFGQVTGTGYDSFGTNRDELLFGFYLAFLQGNRESLIKQFMKSGMLDEAGDRFPELLDRYFSVHEEFVTPVQWADKVNKIFNEVLSKCRQEFTKLNNKV